MSRWRVLKFGGTSLATPARWESIERIVRRRLADRTSLVLVCSAVAGVTDRLTSMARRRRRGERLGAQLRDVRGLHARLGAALGLSTDELLVDEFAHLDALLIRDSKRPDIDAEIIGLGELMSSRIAAAWLSRRGVPCGWVDARELLVSDPGAGQGARRPEDYLSASCTPTPSRAARERIAAEGAAVVATQGFIARSPDGETVLLGRGGSDTSAAYLACQLSAERLEIWTDVPGLFTANPRLIAEARLLPRIGYREAQALGALGAKALHPRAIEAVWEHGIPVELGWTERPEIAGTCINAARAGGGIKAITSRRRLAMFALRRPPSWQPVGFLADVAARFAARGLSMDLVTSSCSEIRVTIDLEAFPSAEAEIPALLRELEAICHPRVVVPVASVSVIGECVSQALLGRDGAFGLFADEALFMVVHAANEHHVSFVLDEQAADHLVRAAHQRLIEDGIGEAGLGPSWRELSAPQLAGEAA